MSKNLFFVVLVLALSVPSRAADCDYYQTLEEGTTYYVFNKEYPNAYTGQQSCRWYAKSASRVRLACEIFSLPATPNCSGDKLAVSPTGDIGLTDAHNYCGTGTFSIESEGNFMNIVLSAVSNSSGGRFLCTLQAVGAQDDNCDCGWKKLVKSASNSFRIEETKIVGGQDTGVNEYPMMAGIIDSFQRSLFCGGTIISEKHVLTAAHCLLEKSVGQLGVLVGDHDITTGIDTNASSLHRVSSFVINPLYNSNTQENDIAVITVADTIQFSPQVGPACLPFQHASYTFEGSQVQALGWGTTEFAGKTSNTLQKVNLDVTTLSSCQQYYSDLTNGQMCTFRQGKDTCQFDSGGPILWQNPNTGRVVSVGIISYGGACASDSPAVNTRVGAYLNWILSVTPGVRYCRAE